MLDWLLELRNVLHLKLQFIIITIKEQIKASQMKRHRAKYRRVLNTASVPSSQGILLCHPPGTPGSVLTNLKAPVESFYWQFHCIDVIDWIIGPMIKFNHQSHSSPVRRGGASAKPQPLNHCVALFEGQLPSWAIFLNFGEIQEYRESSSQQPGTKANQISLSYGTSTWKRLR